MRMACAYHECSVCMCVCTCVCTACAQRVHSVCTALHEAPTSPTLQSPSHVLECIRRRVHSYKMAELLSAAAADFVGGMLQTDERRRWESALGARSASFFVGVPWEAVLSRTAAAPYVPSLRGPADTGNFSYADLRRHGDGDGDGDGGEPEDQGARHHAAWVAF